MQADAGPERPASVSAGGAAPERDDVALLIDFENLKWSLQNRYHVAPSLGSLMEAVGEQGRIVVARAYADWTDGRLRLDAPNLYGAGIEPVYVPGGVRNSADVRMAVDAVDLCGRFANISTFVLVTGDQDLIHALNHLRLQGRRVVIVGVGYSTSAFLSASADAVMVYERDIQPVDETGVDDFAPVSAAGAPPLESTYEYIKTILREQSGREMMPFTKLVGALRERYGFSARDWYGLPFRVLMLRAADAGHVRLSTIGGFDYAGLADSPQPELDSLADAAEADQRGRDLQDTFNIHLEDLSLGEQRTLLTFLHDLQDRSLYMTFKYMVDNLVFHGVLPRLSREQVSVLINHLADLGILNRQSATGVQPDTGMSYSYNTFAYDAQHPDARAVFAPPEDNPFAPLLPAVEEARGENGAASMDDVQEAIERRIERPLTSFGFDSALSYFKAAEIEGLVEIEAGPDGGDVLVVRDAGM
ncbi:MAG TPA: NYN domain-containing protein [Thermomicrobiales bacterium]|nr:NYN domain-containing protein [Thermomicrobiales bacterium]